MKAWKGVVLMWLSFLGFGMFLLALSNPVGFAKFLTTPGNAQLLSLLITIPLMIWMVFWLKKMIDTGGKDPKKFWDDDKDEF